MARRKKRVLTILNMPHKDEWEALKHRPRFLQPVQFSMEPCTRCPGHCCSATIRLSAWEAFRIALLLGITIESMTTLEPVADGEKPPPQSHPFRLDDGRFIFTLRHADSGYDRCVFVMDLDGRGRCGVHALRPGACRIFPFEVEMEGRHLWVGTQAPCPTKWLQDDTTPQKVLADVDAWDADLARDKELVSKWNRGRRKDRSFNAFSAFMVRALAPELGKDPEEILAPPKRGLGKLLG
jgi:Fe-S-cluster containining protein